MTTKQKEDKALKQYLESCEEMGISKKQGLANWKLKKEFGMSEDKKKETEKLIEDKNYGKAAENIFDSW